MSPSRGVHKTSMHTFFNIVCHRSCVPANLPWPGKKNLGCSSRLIIIIIITCVSTSTDLPLVKQGAATANSQAGEKPCNSPKQAFKWEEQAPLPLTQILAQNLYCGKSEPQIQVLNSTEFLNPEQRNSTFMLRAW